MTEKVYLTEEGLENLEKELEYLKVVKRKEISEKIKVARSFGDLSENSEYDEAKNEQAIVEAQIIDIEARLKNVEIIQKSELNTDKIHLGSSVKVKNLSNDKEYTYKIVGSSESDPLNNMLSDESPVGRGLLGHSTGDTVDIEIPAGIVSYEILEIIID